MHPSVATLARALLTCTNTIVQAVDERGKQAISSADAGSGGDKTYCTSC